MVLRFYNFSQTNLKHELYEGIHFILVSFGYASSVTYPTLVHGMLLIHPYCLDCILVNKFIIYIKDVVEATNLVTDRLITISLILVFTFCASELMKTKTLKSKWALNFCAGNRKLYHGIVSDIIMKD